MEGLRVWGVEAEWICEGSTLVVAEWTAYLAEGCREAGWIGSLGGVTDCTIGGLLESSPPSFLVSCYSTTRR